MAQSVVLKKDLYLPLSILLGSLMISLSILASGGVISLSALKNKPSTPSVANPTADPNIPAGNQPVTITVDPITDADYVRGNPNARVVLFEYSDLECPFCKRFHPTAQQALKDYGDDIAWVYRHFPIDQLHPKARKEAEAVECVNKLGGKDIAWKMIDKIYEVTPANNGLDLEKLPQYASEVGVDQAAFKTCLDSGEMASKVETHYQSGVKAGVSGTPGNLLHDAKTGKTIDLKGAVPIENLKQSIDGILKS